MLIWKEWIELKKSLQYVLLSVFFTSVAIWLNKEWYWRFMMKWVCWDKKAIIITSMTEELATYLNFSLFMTLLISLISIFLIIGLYIRKGRYEFEERIFIKNFVIYYIVNLLIYIILCQLVGKWLLFNTSSPHIELIAKMNQYMQRLVWLWLFSIILTSIPLILQFQFVKMTYIKYRKLIMYVIAIIISLLTPPDFLLLIIITSCLFIFLEIFLFIQSCLP